MLAESLFEKTPIYCPFHDDENPSAFINFSENSSNHYIRCSACRFTFWKEEASLEERCEKYWSYKKEVLEMGFTKDNFFFHDIGEKKFYTQIGALDKEAKEEAYSYLANSKHISNIHRVDYLGDIKRSWCRLRMRKL